MIRKKLWIIAIILTVCAIQAKSQTQRDSVKDVITGKPLPEVTIHPEVNKADALNPTAVAGTTMISVEEADRLAGVLDDISRVVRRYAGTTGSAADNGISTHGNPPSTTMYRLEGTEVPAPVHFDGVSTYSTGQISALHTSLLANSDYYTGAAPAEMGNTMGGVMDLRLRNGNPDKSEHSIKLSTLGIDLTTEGPISKQAGSCYIVSYRYGLNKLANDIGLAILEGNQGEYQDMAFKMNFMLNKASTLSIWGLATWDKCYTKWGDWEDWWETLYEQEDYQSKVNTLIGGLSYDTYLAHNWRLRTDLSVAHRDLNTTYSYLVYADDGSVITQTDHPVNYADATPFVRLDDKCLWLTASAAAQKRFSPHYLLKLGASLRHIDYNHSLLRAATIFTGELLPVNSGDIQTEQIDAYATNNLRYRQWTINAGLHLSGWTLSNDWTMQPRFSAEWKPAVNHALAIGYGFTTRTATYDTYCINKRLKPTRSHQLVVDYNWQPTTSVKVSMEAWAELQSNVPVSLTSTYTSLNRRYFYTAEEVAAEGYGRNYGISVGAEQYLVKGFYWMLNGSLYKSEYRDIYREWHPTLFDRGWTMNVAGGKEWKINKRNTLSANIAFTAMGGLRHSPYDDAATAALYAAGSPYVVYDESQPMSKQACPATDLSINVSYRIHGKKIDHIIGIDYMNILANKEPVADYYNYRKHHTQMVYSYLSIPNISYAIVF